MLPSASRRPLPPLQAFLAGVAVGQQLAAASRRRTAEKRVLLAVLFISVLMILGGSALLLGVYVRTHPHVVYHA